MEADEIRRVVEELDRGVPKENARVSIQQHDGVQEAFVVANERGYLRLGVELLKAGFAPYEWEGKPPHAGPRQVEVDIDYLVAEDSAVQFDYFERVEEVTVKPYEQSWGDWAFIGAVLGGIVLVLALAVVGLIAVVRFLL